MALYQIMTKGYQAAEVEATPFTSLVQGQVFNFIYHEAINQTNRITISHVESGMQICDVSVMLLHQYAHNRFDAVETALDDFITKTGQARVRSVLAGAKPMPNNIKL